MAWTNEQIKYLIGNYSDSDNILLSKKLNKHNGIIISKANSLKLYKSEKFMYDLRKKNNPETVWTAEEVEYLKENYNLKSYTELKKILNKTKKGITQKLKRLNLKKDKDAIKKIISDNNIKRGNNYTFEQVKEIALKYNTRTDLYTENSSAYNLAYKNGWLEEICKHMAVRFSTPQLILRNIIEHILEEKCSYDDRKVIYPLEIDCYFEKYKLGWEYDGDRFHKTVDTNKLKKCQEKDICLLIIKENNTIYKQYENNIKKQLVGQLKIINKITSKHISKDDILNYKPIIDYPNVLTKEEKEFVKNNKLTIIRKENEALYKRLIRYKYLEDKLLNIINDIRPMKETIKNYDQYIKFIEDNDIKSYQELCKKDHPNRVMKRLNMSTKILMNYFKN